MMDADVDPSPNPPRCVEHSPSSCDFPTSDVYMEHDDLPDLLEVQVGDESTVQPIYQVEASVSHQEQPAPSETPSLQPPDTRWLTQLAYIATGPQSPLLGKPPHSSSSVVRLSSSSSDLHSYARPPPAPASPRPPSSTLSPPQGRKRDLARSRLNSRSVWMRSSLSDKESIGWSFSWPSTAWHCFLRGTRLHFHSSHKEKWQDVGELEKNNVGDDEPSTHLKSYGSEGLRLVEGSEVVLSGQAVLQLTFDPGSYGHASVTARCQLDHPFYVKNKGWSSFHPSLTVVHYGIPCSEMEVGDVCLPPGHRDAEHTGDSLVFDAFRSHDFTPMDSSAVYVLSSMARRRRDGQSRGAPSTGTVPAADGRRPAQSHGVSPQSGRNSATTVRCKRPMNAFMLFAKKFRVEYTQMYPGKDNRAISVVLGERWKKMRSEERRAFTLQAKALADEQKRLNPDCWKRRPSISGGGRGADHGDDGQRGESGWNQR